MWLPQGPDKDQLDETGQTGGLLPTDSVHVLVASPGD